MWLKAALLGVWVMTAPLAVAETPPSEDARGWLARLGPALNMTTYRGVFVYARGDQVSSMRVAHRYRDGIVEERLVQQDGEGGEIVRKGTRVVCVLPRHGRIQLEQVMPAGPFAETFAHQLVATSEWYQPELLGEDRVAGYSVKVIALQARDGDRYSHRFWLEQQTGLLVKSHVRGEDGRVLESFQFTDLEITDALPDSEFEVQTTGEAVSRTLPSTSEAVVVNRMNGWTLGWQPAGFMPAAAPGSGKGQAVAFSDGLAAFSVFVEPVGALEMPTGVSRIGATTAYMRKLKAGDRTFLVTVVGEIPPETAMRVANSVDIEDAMAFRTKTP
ncbi:MAG: MucB/RseB C-terminal domain-containing protein [Marinobacter sp.]|uniref:MucB/RseB C-terminal domain-containing protein n=1 Tax=Marinobacter sp. TaxID=50741 RepID=UPI00299E6ED3|nr:MucB/RseB C-terminal domain-containing protein [Marinobacter sp.]MDX1754474.1 MucB/RseB C-terminal domain-containing protein [Marinobacter sp.]